MTDMMKPGTYYIGDLCYVMHESWDEVCRLLDGDNRSRGTRTEGVFTLKDGRTFAIFSTAYGDGEYPVIGDGGQVETNERGNRATLLGVDSGTIGCILFNDINMACDADGKNDPTLGTRVHFDEEFRVHSDGETLSFGCVDVETGDQEESEEDDDVCHDCGYSISMGNCDCGDEED
jgi:hypothetical protein